MLKPQLLILFLIVCIPNTFCLFSDTVKAGELLHKIVKRLSTIDGSNTTVEMYPQAVVLLHEFLGELKELNNYKVPAARFNEPELDESRKYERFLKEKEISVIVDMIDERLQEFLIILKYPSIPNELWKELAETVLKYYEPHVDIISMKPFNGTSLWRGGLFKLIVDRVTNETNDQCGRMQTVQNFFITVYKFVVLSEMKNGLMTTWAHTYLHGGAAIKSGWLSITRRARLLEHSNALLTSLKAINASYFRYCDPHNNSWIRGISYIELNGFIQEVIFYYDMFCPHSCMNILDRKRCNLGWFNERSRCHGQITSCQELGHLTGCTSKQGRRKYEWIHSAVYGVQGQNYGQCPEHIGERIKTVDWGLSAASSCHCDCLEKNWTVYLGLLESSAEFNYVITGVRFALEDNMLFLQPAQGKLNANGYIHVFGWVPLPEVVSGDNTGRLDLDHRTFFLDDLSLGSKYALTGIKLNAVERGQETKIRGFSVSISGRPLDFRTGKLDLTPANKRVIRAPPSGIEKELIYKRVRPLDTEIFESQEPSSGEFTYVTLQQSELGYDFGQSTLPLFDNTPVIMERHSPLRGIALFHKGAKHNAGFISVRVRSISYVPYVKELIKLYKANITEV